jgi:small-conductance mechanosensitive channel
MVAGAGTLLILLFLFLLNPIATAVCIVLIMFSGPLRYGQWIDNKITAYCQRRRQQ